VEEGQTGFLVKVGDQQAMAGRVEQLLRDAGRRAHMGRCAAETARTRFDLEHQVNAYLEWYESILHPAGHLQDVVNVIR
jgi:glycosyltransferase involved in cell wall biosynthesis